MQRRDTGIAQSLGKPLLKHVKDSRVLLVGAGGIGCEVLKNLVCCGFGSSSNAPAANEELSELATLRRARAEIVVIDLDTIDLSNLNRQFLFRKQHIKKSKAFVAKETASQFNPSVNIDAQHGSIFDTQYTVDFFESFDLVFNALDNLVARRHVNKMCLAANVPLIESGTTGFNGNVQAIQRGLTECYDCAAKETPKSFPICTIRSTPSQPIHCIVWAKSYLLPELFGASVEESKDVAVTDEDNTEEVAKLKEEAEALKNVRSLMGKGEFAQALFDKVFHDDIERLRSMEEMWQSRKKPTSLQLEALIPGGDPVKNGKSTASQDQLVWGLQQNVAVFCYSLDVLSKRVAAGESVIEFDKDDKDTLDFVTSAANLRSHIFGIPLHSEWDIKKMAGNIIPAIATSNALTASLCVLEAFKIMRHLPAKAEALAQPSANTLPTSTQSITVNGKDSGVLGGAKMMYLASGQTGRLFDSGPHSKPRPDCPVCSPTYAKLVIPTGNDPTLQTLVNLLKEKVGYEDLSITTASDAMIYDPDLEDNLEKLLSEVGIDAKSNGLITIMDDSDDARVDLLLSISEGMTTNLRLVPPEIKLPLKPKKEVPALATNSAAGDNEDVVIADTPTAAPGMKRKRGADDLAESANKGKKARPTVVEDDSAIVVEDD